MKKQIRQTVKERNAFKSDSINHGPLGFTRNYSATANPQISLSNISNEIANQFNSFSVILNQTLSKTITEQIKTSMNELKLEINASVSKFIEKTMKMCAILFWTYLENNQLYPNQMKNI